MNIVCCRFLYLFPINIEGKYDNSLRQVILTLGRNSCKMPDIFSDFNQSWIFYTKFNKTPSVKSG
jgi:hypothetical protein